MMEKKLDFSLPKSNFKAIVFDLDDTLVDTYNNLIAPLELSALRRMASLGLEENDILSILSIILDMRKSKPEMIETELLRLYPDIAHSLIKERDKIFDNASPKGLKIRPEVYKMLLDLDKKYNIFLLTTGSIEFQKAKINLIDLDKVFKCKNIYIVDGNNYTDKEDVLSRLAKKYSDNKSIVVIGNRLDNEIQAGNKLGMITVWVKHGEGSEMIPTKHSRKPHYIISDIVELCNVI